MLDFIFITTEDVENGNEQVVGMAAEIEQATEPVTV